MEDRPGRHLLEGTSSIGHLWRAGVGGTSLVPVVELTGLLEHEVSVSVVPVTLRQDQREQKVENNISVVHRVSRNVGHEPVPELGECSTERKMLMSDIG